MPTISEEKLHNNDTNCVKCAVDKIKDDRMSSSSSVASSPSSSCPSELSQLMTSLVMMVINSRGIGEETVTMETQRRTSQRKSVSEVNVDDIEVLSGDGSVCVEIKGQPVSGQSSILLEKWTIQILTNEDNCAGHIISLKYLNSAVRSFLYFSQINSWVVSYKGHLPFTLIYRLSSCDNGSGLPTSDNVDCHTFPSVINGSHMVLVRVHHLPRLPSMPSSLTTPTSSTTPTTKSSTSDCTTTATAIRGPTTTRRVVSVSHASHVPDTKTTPSHVTGATPTGPSSPIPQYRDRGTTPHDYKRYKRRSFGCNVKLSTRRQLPSRSLSLPCSVPPLCLLGTFEESLLNGRIEPCGYVEGFTAQLGASGSFCPSHLVAVPVSAAFFNLSDDGGPSPYLGHINLSDVTSNGRYRIPLAGTIQLTLFNPNQTVVKMYIVHYDHSDMPPNTSTFIRQKTITDPVRLVERLPPPLHYLIHLRFLCSSSNKLYLHTDIKLIFARRLPDDVNADDPSIPSSFITTNEGPSDPKYCPIVTANDI